MNLPTKLFALLILPSFCFSQSPSPRFQNDTVYTSCGYKIYPGEVLNFGKASGNLGHFRFVKIYSSDHNVLGNAKVLVKKISGISTSGLGNVYAHITGSLLHKDGTTDRVSFALNFDRAISGLGIQAGELIVPDEFKNKTQTKTAAEQLQELKGMLDNNSISKQEYDSLKKIIKP